MSDQPVVSTITEIENLVLRAHSPVPSYAPRVVDAASVPYLVLPNASKVEQLEHLYPSPFRIRRDVELNDVSSFVDYWRRFASAGQSLVAACLERAQMKAIFDYHKAGEPAWCSHTATLRLKESDEWNAWVGADHRRMSQVEFAEFIENHQEEIVDPDGSSLMEVITNLQNKRNVAFRSAVRLADGRTQFEFSEEDAPGSMVVPQVFTIGVAPFHRYDRFKIVARLRYRIEDKEDRKRLVMWYDLNEPKRVREQAFNEIAQRISDETGPLYFGAL